MCTVRSKAKVDDGSTTFGLFLCADKTLLEIHLIPPARPTIIEVNFGCRNTPIFSLDGAELLFL